MVGRSTDGGDKGGFGVRLAHGNNVFDFPQVRLQRRQNEFCDAVARLKAALANEKALPVSTRQVLVAELGVFDNWAEDGATVLPAVGGAREIARRILLLDYRLSVLGPLAEQLDRSLCHAVRQYAEASALLLEATARRGPDGDWLDRPRRTEIELLVLALHGNTPPEDGGGEDGR